MTSKNTLVGLYALLSTCGFSGEVFEGCLLKYLGLYYVIPQRDGENEGPFSIECCQEAGAVQ